jgi:hypothetical protein
MNSPWIYDWGEEVRVMATAPQALRPDEAGSICGMRKADTGQIYLVDFQMGGQSKSRRNFCNESERLTAGIYERTWSTLRIERGLR